MPASWSGADGKEGPISFDLPATGFWLGLLVPLIGYVLYPALALLVGRFARSPVSTPGPWPSVTVAIAAHNEEATIVRAVRSILDQRYPGPAVGVLVGLDGCSDGTAGALASLSDPRVTVLDLPRAGKAATDNRLVAAATTEVIVTTSAGAEFGAGSLAKLVEPLRDPRVGCATGVFQPRPDDGVAIEGERLYWGLENRVMEAESRFGALAMASGTALAFRRSLFAPIPGDSDADVTVAPTVVLQGRRVVHVPGAVVYDDGPSTLRIVFRNRRRMTLRALPATLGLIPRLIRAGRYRAATALTFHKIFRWLTPAAAIIWTASAIVLWLRGDPLFRALIALLVGSAVAVVVLALLRPAIRTALAGLVAAQLAFLAAFVDAVLGRRARLWSREGQ